MVFKFSIFRVDDDGNPIIEEPPKLLKDSKLRPSPDIIPELLGKILIIDLSVKKGYRVSPGVNPRAKRIGELAKGKSLAERKRIFAGIY